MKNHSMFHSSRLLLAMLSLLFAGLLLQCTKEEEKEIPPLEYNIFDDPTVELITYDSIKTETLPYNRKNMYLYYTAHFEKFPPAVAQRIETLTLHRDNGTYLVLEPTRKHLYIQDVQKGAEVCFRFSFRDNEGYQTDDITKCAIVP